MSRVLLLISFCMSLSCRPLPLQRHVVVPLHLSFKELDACRECGELNRLAFAAFDLLARLSDLQRRGVLQPSGRHQWTETLGSVASDLRAAMHQCTNGLAQRNISCQWSRMKRCAANADGRSPIQFWAPGINCDDRQIYLYVRKKLAASSFEVVSASDRDLLVRTRRVLRPPTRTCGEVLVLSTWFVSSAELSHCHFAVAGWNVGGGELERLTIPNDSCFTSAINDALRSILADIPQCAQQPAGEGGKHVR